MVGKRVGVEVGAPEAGPGLPVRLRGDPGVPLLVGVADRGAGGAEQLPADQVGDRHVLRPGESRRVQGRVERLLDIQHVRSDRQPGHVVVQQPRMGGVDPPGRVDPRLDPGPPAQVRIGQRVVGVDPVDHQLDQLGAAGHVGVERHRPDAELAGDLAHGEGLQPFGVGDRHPRRRRPRPGWSSAVARGPGPCRRIPQQFDHAAALRRAGGGLDGELGAGARIGHRRLLGQKSVSAKCLSYLRTVYAILIRYGVRS